MHTHTMRTTHTVTSLCLFVYLLLCLYAHVKLISIFPLAYAAAGLFSLSAMFNHSCEPSVAYRIRTLGGARMEFIAKYLLFLSTNTT